MRENREHNNFIDEAASDVGSTLPEVEELKNPEAEVEELKNPEAEAEELKNPEAEVEELKNPEAEAEELKNPEAEVEEAVQEKIGTVSGCEKLNVRKAPISNAEVVCVIPVGTQVMINLEKSTEDFYSVCTSAGVNGFCKATFITVQP